MQSPSTKELGRQDERERRSLAGGTGEFDGEEAYNLVPPPAEFRTVRNMYRTETSAAWFCLPRDLDTTPAVEDSEAELKVLTTLPCARSTVARPSLLKHDADSISLAEKRRHKARAQLVVVRMYSSTAALRNESDTLEMLHDTDRGEMFIGAWILRQVHCLIPTDGYLSLRPIFGKTLDAFGQACLDSTRIPTYFAWHTFLSLISALEFVHEAGIAHGDLSSANVMLRCSLPGRRNQYHDWPDVVLTGFEVEADMELYDDEKNEDVKRMAKIMYSDVISRWSDAGGLLGFLDLNKLQSDPLMQLAAALKTLIEASSQASTLRLGDLEVWKGVAVTERAKGPELCPTWIKTAAYDALVMEEELEKAMRPPLVLKFGPDSESFKEWVRARRTPVAVLGGLLVIKFKYLGAELAKLR
jgi:serine/threonine protein kinase